MNLEKNHSSIVQCRSKINKKLEKFVVRQTSQRGWTAISISNLTDEAFAEMFQGNSINLMELIESNFTVEKVFKHNNDVSFRKQLMMALVGSELEFNDENLKIEIQRTLRPGIGRSTNEFELATLKIKLKGYRGLSF